MKVELNRTTKDVVRVVTVIVVILIVLDVLLVQYSES